MHYKCVQKHNNEAIVYDDNYDIVDEEMSDSNIGARKEINIRIHVFMLKGVVNEAVHDKFKAIDIQIVDYKQCSDSMWLD